MRSVSRSTAPAGPLCLECRRSRTSKECLDCHEVKPLDAFPLRSDGRAGGRGSWCKSCYVIRQRERGLGGYAKRLVNCPGCGNPQEQTIKSKGVRRCVDCVAGDRIRRGMTRLALAETKALERRASSERKAAKMRRVFLAGKCLGCSESFVMATIAANSNNARYCSAECRAKHRNKGRVRRKLPVSPRLIFERDEWTCGICQGAVDRTLAWPHDFSAVVDHIFPVSAGGPNEEWNLQAAHNICNRIKSDAATDELYDQAMARAPEGWKASTSQVGADLARSILESPW